MMLTSVAFKFVIADTLPKVNYSTELDSYLHVSFFGMFTLCCYFFLAPYYCEETGDKWAMWAYIIVFFVHCMWWGFNSWLLVMARRLHLPPSIKNPQNTNYVSYRWQDCYFLNTMPP